MAKGCKWLADDLRHIADLVERGDVFGADIRHSVHAFANDETNSIGRELGDVVLYEVWVPRANMLQVETAS